MRNRFFIIIYLLTLLGLPSHAQILNGDFETGTLSGWNYGGNGSTQLIGSGNLGVVSVPRGAFFALVGNGSGDVNNDNLPDQAFLESTPFDITGSGSSISITWDFFTAEFTGLDNDPNRLDNFKISLISQGGQETILKSGNVADQQFSLIDSGNVTAAPDGTAFFERLGFQTNTFSILNGTYSLRFSVFDDGDGSFDSALGIDNINIISNSSSAPEPTSCALLLFCVIFLPIIYFRPHTKC
jgi:hypothetical protein